jgi:hypothetical protein
MRPERHMFPKAAWPARWVPPPETRGIRATARPVITLSEAFPTRMKDVGGFNCTYQYPRTRQKSDDQPSHSQHMAASCSWPCQCEQSYNSISTFNSSCRGLGIRILDNVRANWRLEDTGERVCLVGGSAICTDNGDCRTARHGCCCVN